MSRQVRHAANSIALDFDVWAQHLPDQGLQATEFDDEELVLSLKSMSAGVAEQRQSSILLTAKLPSAALAARCTSVSRLLRRNKMGSRVSRPTGLTSFSVISAKARAALRWRSTLSEKESVVNALSGEPEKKLVVVRSVCF